MRPFHIRLRERRALLALVPAALAARLMPAQTPDVATDPRLQETGPEPSDQPRLPNGRNQKDEIAKEDYSRNVRDARELIDLAKSFELDLEKDDRFVLSLSSLKKLDDIEKLTRRIRGRLKGA